MTETEASPVVNNRGTPNKVLVYVTRETIMRILRAYLSEVKTPMDTSPFIDRVMVDLTKEDQTVNNGAFDHIFGKGNFFSRSFK
jgi:hypothetical protein